MKALSLAIQKIWPMLKFLQTERRTGQKLYAPDLSIRGHKKILKITLNRINVEYFSESVCGIFH
jgi:hypothetical protein